MAVRQLHPAGTGLGRRLRIALYQPDIAGNTGTILRMAACLGVAVDIIEPAGFDLSDRNLRRAGMDYLEMAALTRHVDFDRFEDWRRGEGRRLVLFSTKAALPYTDFALRATATSCCSAANRPACRTMSTTAPTRGC